MIQLETTTHPCVFDTAPVVEAISALEQTLDLMRSAHHAGCADDVLVSACETAFRRLHLALVDAEAEHGSRHTADGLSDGGTLLHFRPRPWNC